MGNLKIDQFFADRLKKQREKLGLSLKEMAKLVGLSNASYENFETGKTLPSNKIAEFIAKNLKCSLQWLAIGKGKGDQSPTPEQDNTVKDSNSADSPEFDYTFLPGRLKLVRLKFGFIQKQMGAHCGVGAYYYGKLERGRERASEEIALKIADACGIDSVWLLTGKGDEPVFPDQPTVKPKTSAKRKPKAGNKKGRKKAAVKEEDQKPTVEIYPVYTIYKVTEVSETKPANRLIYLDVTINHTSETFDIDTESAEEISIRNANDLDRCETLSVLLAESVHFLRKKRKR